ncbi:hypothetical protein I6N95_26510 [Vagococcus sp. BWB3-3]|uniref:Uncharacterized protein n=1 Tax=Vagococcus allomyrinae TaxID=2794353 RepID=A0A940PII1_9ENTE|nr:hypothetical protein [Vagococcus allomyrinae]MBP1044568.1 hypothetical protein [Vagococcus allomyrinae]
MEKLRNYQSGTQSKMYGEYCYASDVEREALTVKLFSTNEIWCNLNDGRFVRRSDLARKAVIKNSANLYEQIKNVEAAGFIIARRIHPNAPLKYLLDPIPIRKKGRYRPKKLEHAVYKKG